MMNKQQYIWVGSHNVMNLMNNRLASLALHTPSSVIMDQSGDGSVVSLLSCVLLSWIKAWNSLWFYFWSHDTAFIYTAPATYPTINNGNVKNKIKCLKHYFLVSKVIMVHWLSCLLNICKTDNIVHFILAATN